MSGFVYGAMVRLRIDPKVTGMVIGEVNWGDVYNVRVAPSLAVQQFDSVELELIDAPTRGASSGNVVDLKNEKALRGVN